MKVDAKIERILRLYPDECQPRAVDPIATTGGFSGARLWRVEAPRGPLCLRRWPPGHPSQERLEFIQAVLWHVDQEGFHAIPLPLETRHQHGYVLFAGHLWELTPWLPGKADFRQRPSPARLSAAMASLARFHRAAATFPLPEPGPAASPGILERRARLSELMAGRLDEIRHATSDPTWPELSTRGRDLLGLFGGAAGYVLSLLDAAASIRVRLQPCIRDIWHAHVLYEQDLVTGLVDFGSLRADNVAADVARLLGSMTLDNREQWQLGLAAYQQTRPLDADELQLVTAFDRSTVLLGGVQWLEWIFLEGRVFSDRGAVLSRVDEFLTRLAHLPRGAA